MRTISDANGVVWTIFEVKKQGAGDQWTYLPEQFGNGWLCFESGLNKRRLTPVPARWTEFSHAELADLVRKAEPVLRSRITAEQESRAESG